MLCSMRTSGRTCSNALWIALEQLDVKYGHSTAEIARLRDLHAAMDRAVLDAYGHRDVRPECGFALDEDQLAETMAGPPTTSATESSRPTTSSPTPPRPATSSRTEGNMSRRL